eukprot:m.802538 g.802538  ORF g.802538 m.802538 type:complete len:300 (-) comp23362_c0_seq1:247-1146(-)
MSANRCSASCFLRSSFRRFCSSSRAFFFSAARRLASLSSFARCSDSCLSSSRVCSINRFFSRRARSCDAFRAARRFSSACARCACCCCDSSLSAATRRSSASLSSFARWRMRASCASRSARRRAASSSVAAFCCWCSISTLLRRYAIVPRTFVNCCSCARRCSSCERFLASCSSRSFFSTFALLNCFVASMLNFHSSSIAARFLRARFASSRNSCSRLLRLLAHDGGLVLTPSELTDVYDALRRAGSLSTLLCRLRGFDLGAWLGVMSGSALLVLSSMFTVILFQKTSRCGKNAHGNCE